MMFSVIRRLVAVAGVLWLGACAATPAPSAVEVIAATDAPPPAVVTETTPPPPPAPDPVVSTPQPAPKPRRVARLPAPESLLDASGRQVRLKLGSPDFRRVDGGAEIWQYRGQSCSLDLFLYGQADKLTVRHLELRDRAGGKADRIACLDDIARNRPQQESG